MFSLFQERPPEENPSPETPVQKPHAVERLRAFIPHHLPFNPMSTALLLALVAVLVFGLHERRVAAHLSAQSTDAAAQLKDTQAQISALNAKLDSLATAQANVQQQQESARQVPPPAPAVRKGIAPLQSTGRRQKPDPRWRRMQNQLDAQGKAIESTRQELASARTDLQGSIAKTHEDLVVLQKRGERNYFEFDLDKSKNFHPTGPVGISLRKANTKHQYADLELLVDDRQLSKKHLNLYEPVVFYPSDERQPVELVINSINKNHIHGYISSAKYKAAELTATAGASGEQENKTRRKLDVR
jgi:DNA repair exonuclease SbcCD ATPase subunit